MKPWFLVLFLCCLTLCSQAQTIPRPLPTAGRNMDMRTIKQNAILRALPASTLTNPRKLAAIIHQQQPSLTTNPGPSPAKALTSLSIPKATGRRTTSLGNPAACMDTSFTRLIGLANSAIYLVSMTHTADDGVLLAGELYDTTVVNGSWHANAFVVKTDNNGNLLWSRIFNNTNPLNIIYYLNFTRIKELRNGDILVSGYTDTSNSNNPMTTVFRLGPQGNIIWYSNLKSNIVLQTQWVYIAINNITEGLNGEFLLSGTTIGENSGAHYETIIRMDQAGSVIWDMNFGNIGDYMFGAEGLNAFLDNGNILFVGMSHGSDNPTIPDGVNLFTLDYANGQVLNKKFFVPDYSDPGTLFRKQFTYYYNSVRQLANGHIIVYGPLFSAYAPATDTLDYYGLMEFDAAKTFVKGYTISSRIHSPNENTDVFFDDSGNGLFSITNYPGLGPEDILFGSVQNNRIARQRYKTYNSGATIGYTNFCHFNDGGYLYASSLYDPTPGQGSYMQFKKLHDTDTASVCLGTDSLFAMQLPLYVKEDPTYRALDPPVANQITNAHYSLGSADITATLTDPPCNQKNLCDILKIKGQPVICGVNTPQLFTVHKNTGCGSVPLWDIDTAIAQNISITNDTTIAITFKNTNWQGKLYAYLPVGTCIVPQSDSLTLHITSAPQAVNLGPDTILCAGNSILLHAGPNFAAYTWQDGSTDSTYKLTSPGAYSVDVTDYCGNSSASSIQVSPANFHFSLGPTVTKCNADTVRLLATGGFINYQWSPSAFMTLTPGTADSIVQIFPQQDADYTVNAEKWAGCAVSSTIHITVNHSPVINLGNDTSFCDGGSKTLDAGAGFDTYKWNTGASSRQIAASQAGKYLIMATAANGCSSYDTLNILNVFPLPSFSLASGPDTLICTGQPLIYQFPVNGNSYQWNDGSTSGHRTIGLPGSYGLTVTTPDGCSTSHSVDVSVKPSPVVWLGNDTTLCAATKKLLDASNGNATYKWQDGNTDPVYTVRQAGLYFVTVTINGCSASDSVKIAYTGPPEFTLGKDTFLCKGQVFALIPALSPPVSYRWQDGSTDDHYIVRDTGSYTLTATNICGDHTAGLYVGPGLCKLIMPSGFTPNQDGKNDLFRIKYPFAVRQFHMVVFDRWGGKVFESTDIRKGWDGNFHGVPQPTGTYAWYISLTSDDNIRESDKGTVILVR